MLLHGFGASLFSWRAVLANPTGLGRVFAFDRPAFGLTERRLDWDFSPEAQAALTVALLDRWGIQAAVLVGNSAGGTLALQIARRYPERVTGLVLVAAAVYRGGGAPPFIKPLLRTTWARRLGLMALRRMRERAIRALLRSYHDPTKVTRATLDGYLKPLQAPLWDEALWNFTLASRASNLAPHLKEIKQPALVISGENDRIVPAAESRRLAAELPNGRYVGINDCGHLPQEERPGEFLAAVRTFLKELQ